MPKREEEDIPLSATEAVAASMELIGSRLGSACTYKRLPRVVCLLFENPSDFAPDPGLFSAIKGKSDGQPVHLSKLCRNLPD